MAIIKETSVAQEKLNANIAAGLLNQGAGFAPPLPVGEYEGISKGEFEEIQFDYKSQKEGFKGKRGFIMLVHVLVGKVSLTVPAKEVDLSVYDKDESVTFEVYKDKNGEPRTRFIAVAGDLNVNGDKAADIQKQIDTLKESIVPGMKAKDKNPILAQIAELEEQLEAVEE